MYIVDTSLSNHAVRDRVMITLFVISETITCSVGGVKVVTVSSLFSLSFWLHKGITTCSLKDGESFYAEENGA